MNTFSKLLISFGVSMLIAVFTITCIDAVEARGVVNPCSSTDPVMTQKLCPISRTMTIATYLRYQPHPIEVQWQKFFFWLSVMFALTYTAQQIHERHLSPAKTKTAGGKKKKK